MIQNPFARFFIFSLISATSCVQRHNNEASVRIRNGTPTVPGGFIDKVTTPVGVKGKKGSGVWIHKKIVLTAAHVANGSLPVAVAWTDGSAYVGARNIVPHPQFRIINAGQSSENDISILFLDNPSTVAHSAQLATDSNSIAIGKELTIAGYGGTGSFLNQINMTIVPWQDQREIRLEDKSQKGGVCAGDSGGPAFVPGGGNLKLAGVSAHADCNKGVMSSTNILHFMPWIQQVLSERGFSINSNTGEVTENSTTGNSNTRPTSETGSLPEGIQPSSQNGSIPEGIQPPKPEQKYICYSTSIAWVSKDVCLQKCPQKDLCGPAK